VSVLTSNMYAPFLVITLHWHTVLYQ